jgi:hypothetical protein
VRRRSLSRHRNGEPSMPSCPGPLLICVMRPSSLPFAPCIQMLNDRPLEDLPQAPTITMTELKKAVRKMDLCAAAGPDGMLVLLVSGLMRSTAGDGGVQKGAKALLAFMQVCANGNLTPCVERCFGTAKHVSVLKNTASCLAVGLRPLAVGTVRCRLASILVLHKALPFAADYLLPHKLSTVAAAGTDILVHGFREKLEHFGMIQQGCAESRRSECLQCSIAS